MKSFFVILGFLVASNAMAQGSFVRCERTDQADDWRVDLNLETGEALFFDNDTEVEGRLTSQTKSLPPILTFQSDVEADNWTFQFQEAEKANGYWEGSLFLDGSEEPTEFDCYAVQDDGDR